MDFSMFLFILINFLAVIFFLWVCWICVEFVISIVKFVIRMVKKIIKKDVGGKNARTTTN